MLPLVGIYYNPPKLNGARMQSVCHPQMKGGLMAETKPIQIFVCHASEDRAAGMAIYDRLKALGYKP